MLSAKLYLRATICLRGMVLDNYAQAKYVCVNKVEFTSTHERCQYLTSTIIPLYMIIIMFKGRQNFVLFL